MISRGIAIYLNLLSSYLPYPSCVEQLDSLKSHDCTFAFLNIGFTATDPSKIFCSPSSSNPAARYSLFPAGVDSRYMSWPARSASSQSFANSRFAMPRP